MVQTGKFHYSSGLYFNGKYVVNGSCDWYVLKDETYYVTLRVINDKAVEVLSFVKKTS